MAFGVKAVRNGAELHVRADDSISTCLAFCVGPAISS